jgi:hypothetical protein
MNDRLSPKSAPPTIIDVMKGTETSVALAMPAAMGTRATMVPTLVPMHNDVKQAATKSPERIIEEGRRFIVSETMELMLPISFAELAKAPAITNIHSMLISPSLEAPRVYTLTRFCTERPPVTAMAYMLLIMNTTMMGTLLKSRATMLVTK